MPFGTGTVPFPFGHCRICQDKATGFHYGVATCEGCKGFFKRSMPKGDKYTCFFGGHCNITPFNRNQCKACRFKRCLDNGMAIDAVKMGRIPQVEKERALVEGVIQIKPHGNMDTEEPVLAASHNEWIIFDRRKQEPQTQTTTAHSCESPLKWNLLGTSQGRHNDMTAIGDQLFTLEWKDQEGKELLSKSKNHQSVVNPVHTDILLNEGCMQRYPNTCNPGSFITHKNTLLEKSGGLNEKVGVFSTISSKSSAPIKYENQFCSSFKDVDCHEPSYQDQLSVKLESYAQGKTSFTEHGISAFDWSNIETNEIKIEHDVYRYKRTVNCDDPFSESSVRFKQHETVNCNFSTPLANVTSSGVFDNKSMFSTESGVDKDCFVEHRNDEMCTASNMAVVGSSYENVKCKKSTSNTQMDNTSRGDNNQNTSETKIYRKHCYSPDIIKVLMDQVGEDGINGMKQQIMTTIAKTFGPDECEATAELLTSYTSSTGQQRDIYSNFPKQSHNAGQHDFSLVSECQSFHLNSSSNSANQHPDINKFFVVEQHKHDLSSLATSSNRTLIEHSPADLSTVSPIFPCFEAEHSSRLQQTYSEQQESGMLNEENIPKLANDLKFVLCSSPSTGVHGFELQDCHDAVDTFECLKSNACRQPTVLNGQFITEDYKGGIPRSIDKASVSSQNSSSDKDFSNSSDASILDDFTMVESALTLKAAYKKHMPDIARKQKRMLDYIHNKKAIPSHPVTPEGKAKVYSNLIAAIPNINKCIIGFGHDVPRFASLPKEDKEILMKRGYYDIWMLMNSKFFYEDDSYLQFEDGTFYTRALMEAILNVTIVQKLITFAKKLNSLALSDLEIAILCAIQLTSVSHEPLNLKCHETIQQMNSYFVDLLVQEVTKQHPSNCSRILVDIFRLMPDLSEINLMQREIIANFSVNKLPENVEYTPKTVPLADISETDLEALADS